MAESTKKAFLTKDGLVYYDGKSKTWVKAQIATAKSEAIDASAITVDTTTTTEGYAKSYTLKQNGATITTIDIPKDMVVSSGKVVKNPEGQAEGTYLELTLANATEDKIYINVGTLVDIYTAQENATQVQLTVDNATHVISAEIVDGSIDTDALGALAVTTAKIADGAVTTVKILDKNVTLAKLADDVQASLGKADTAVQEVETGDTNGTIAVDGTDVAVKGLGSAAYTSADVYDAAGTAEAKVNALADGAVATNTEDIAELKSKVSALENAEIAEISNDDIDALFTTPAQNSDE